MMKTVVPLLLGALQAAAQYQLLTGAIHTCVKYGSTDVRCFGNNYYGQFGIGTTSSSAHSSGPGTPMNLLAGKSVASIFGDASYNTWVLYTDNTVSVSGTNYIKIMANSVYGFSGHPTQFATLTTLTSPVQDIDNGFVNACALTTSGSVHCWGACSRGESGDSTTGAASGCPVPSNVTLPAGRHAIDIGVGGCAGNVIDGNVPAAGTPCAVLDDFSLVCWGYNAYGQIGDGTTTQKLLPQSISLSNVTDVEGGAYHTCAIHSGGNVSCWGRNTWGQVGNGRTQDSEPTPQLVILPAPATKIALTRATTCVLLTTQRVMCWGQNTYGVVGDGTNTERNSPVYINIPASDPVNDISGGFQHNCITMAVGCVIKCWGGNGYGYLGTGDTNSVNTPKDMTNPICPETPGPTIMPSSAPTSTPSTKAPSTRAPSTRAPSVIPGDGLSAWYIADTIQDPDGSSISFWMDSSGNNHHVNQSDSALMPTLKENAMNGHKTLKFGGNLAKRLTGIDSWKEELLAGQDGLTAFVVIKDATRDRFPIDRGYYPSQGWGIDNAGLNSLAGYTPNQYPSAFIANIFGLGSWVVYIRVNNTDQTFHTGICDYIRGPDSTSTTISSATMDFNNRFTIGAQAKDPSRLSGGRWTDGEIPEVIVYSRPLANTEVTEVVQYFKAKYGTCITLSPTTSPSIPSTPMPSQAPSLVPSMAPSFSPSGCPSGSPTSTPSTCPSCSPSSTPTTSPGTASPTSTPSASPSGRPTTSPTSAPTSGPSISPSWSPSSTPTPGPTTTPTSAHPTKSPHTLNPHQGTYTPTATVNPTIAPSSSPTKMTMAPSRNPSTYPSLAPTNAPSHGPSMYPSVSPTGAPSMTPSISPTDTPSLAPSTSLTSSPSGRHGGGGGGSSLAPTNAPSHGPIMYPSVSPTGASSMTPSISPTDTPSLAPSTSPTSSPSGRRGGGGGGGGPSNPPNVSPRLPSASPTSSPTELEIPVVAVGGGSGADGNLLLIAAIAGVLGLLCCCLILFLCCRRRRKKKQPKEKISDMVMAEGQIIDVIDSNPSIELGKVSGLNLTTDSQGSNPVRSGMFQVGETKIVTSGPMI